MMEKKFIERVLTIRLMDGYVEINPGQKTKVFRVKRNIFQKVVNWIFRTNLRTEYYEDVNTYIVTWNSNIGPLSTCFTEDALFNWTWKNVDKEFITPTIARFKAAYRKALAKSIYPSYEEV